LADFLLFGSNGDQVVHRVEDEDEGDQRGKKFFSESEIWKGKKNETKPKEINEKVQERSISVYKLV